MGIEENKLINEAVVEKKREEVASEPTKDESVSESKIENTLGEIKTAFDLIKTRKELGLLSPTEEEKALKNLSENVNQAIKPLLDIQKDISFELKKFDKSEVVSKENNEDLIRRNEIIKFLNQAKNDLLNDGKRLVLQFDDRESRRFDKLIDPDMIGVLAGGLRDIDAAITPGNFDVNNFEQGIGKIRAVFDDLLTHRGNGADSSESLWQIRKTLDDFMNILENIRKKIAGPKYRQVQAQGEDWKLDLSKIPEEYEDLLKKVSGCVSVLEDKIRLLKNRSNIVSEHEGGR